MRGGMSILKRGIKSKSEQKEPLNMHDNGAKVKSFNESTKS